MVESNQRYKVKFSVGYKTNYGEVMCIVGGLDQLGKWKSFHNIMKWNDGHKWTIEMEFT